jgi:prophage maintenance system killer protein
VLCTHLVKNHPLKDGNAQVALIATIEFAGRNGFTWTSPPGDDDGAVTAKVLFDLAAAPISEVVVKDMARWVGARLGFPGHGPVRN